jgi:hypothetical protein
MQIAVIGDVGGHREALHAELVRLGMNPGTFELPDDLTVVQVGDLIHKGPDSDGVVAMVDELMKVNGSRWVQLLGNHESLHVTPPTFGWNETLSDETILTLQRWWADGSMQLAASFDVEGAEVRRAGGVREVIGAGGVLVTHAGLTHGCWKMLGITSDVHAVAERINNERYNTSSCVWNTGRMLEGWVNSRAGVVWAEAGVELVQGWLDSEESPGFHQVHGHSTMYWWHNNRWVPADLGRSLGDRVKLDPLKRHSRAELHGQVVWGVDPAHSRDVAPSWEALTLSSAAR